MPRKTRLKVYRTAIGFHDAYVAAPSQKAALEAWKAETNLFAMGAAEMVSDPELTSEALAAPGTVIRKPRGTTAEHLAAAEPVKSQTARRRAETPEPPGKKSPATKPVRLPKPKPRPSRKRLEEAEKALGEHQAQVEAALAEIRLRELRLGREREALQRKHAQRADQLKFRLDRARTEYEAALNAQGRD
jgi:hypothetical protein